MKRRASAWVVIAGACACALAGAAVGCGSGNPAVSGSTEEATVKGVVRVRGKVVNNGMVTFRSSNVNRPQAQTKEAPIGKDGSYSVTTLVGQNFVEVTCKEILSAKNRDLLENERVVNVQSGDNTVDIDIPPQPGK